MQLDQAGKKLVFLFARQRSGTGALSSLLNQHDSCNYLGEVFGSALSQHSHHYFNWLQNAAKSGPELLLPDFAPRRFRAYLSYLSEVTDEQVLVLDVKISQTHHFEPYDRGINARPGLYDLVRDLGGDVIFLRRQNLVRTYLSRLSATESDVWHAVEERPDLPLLNVDTKNMLRVLQQFARREKYIDGLQKHFPGALVLTYETLFDEVTNRLAPEAAESLARVLGLSGLDQLETQQRKLRPGRLEDIVENHFEVRQALTGTEFESMVQ